VTRKLFSCVLALGLLAAACGSKGGSSQAVKVSFLPQTVDFLDDVGRGLSLALDQEGNPHLTYIGLLPVLKKDEIAPARPIDAPALPAVLTSDFSSGIWSHGDVVQTDITKANGAKVPVGTLDTTATAIDAKDVQHLVWTQVRGLWYSSRQLGQTVGQFSKPTMAVDGYISGPSLAVDQDGVPWAAYYVGSTVQVATLQGKTWTTQDVTTVGQCSGCPPLRTAIAATSSGPIVAYTDPATKQAMVATSVFGTWNVQPVEASGGPGGFGVSLALDPKGVPYVSFVTQDGQVVVARQSGAATWTVTSVGSFQPGSLKDLGGGTAVAVDPRHGTVYVAWADPVADEVRLVSGSGTSFEPITTPGTQLGELPAAQVSRTGKLNLAWYDAVDQDLLLGTYPESLGLFALPSPSASASPTTTTVTACKPTESGTSLKLVAKNTAFDTDCIGAPAGQGFKILFDNQDAQVQHNVEVYTNASTTTRVGGATSATDVITGVASVTYSVPGLQAGNYYFRCDIHPTVMFGTLVVK
jgi:plastocyanin